MQVKPYFHEFTILESIDLFMDDFGTMFRLLTYEGKYKEKDINGKEIEKHEKDTLVCARNIYKWRNGATSYDQRILWKSDHVIGFSKQINGFTITEVKCEYGHSYCEDGIATKFIVHEKL